MVRRPTACYDMCAYTIASSLAVDITPTLFAAFLDAFRQKRNTSTSAMQDISRMAEFGIFVYLLKILDNIKETHVAVYLESSCRLLKELLQWNVYTARNDDIAQSQQVVLNGIADDVVSYLSDSKRKCGSVCGRGNDTEWVV